MLVASVATFGVWAVKWVRSLAISGTRSLGIVAASTRRVGLAAGVRDQRLIVSGVKVL